MDAAASKPTFRTWALHVLWIAPFVLGIAASAILFVDYVRPALIFCEEGGGCDAVKHTIFARVGGIPTPAFGLVAFIGLSLLALLRGARARLLLVLAAIPVALVAAFLIAVQRTMGVYCKYCIAVDLSALVVLLIALLRYRREWDLEPSRLLRGMLMVAPVAAVAVPLVVGFNRKLPPPKKVPLPPMIAAEIAKTPRGQITIVDFADFECPWCRLTHASLSPVVKARGASVRLVRKQVPLTIHEHALPAALAAVCADQEGHGEEMAEALFATEPDQLTLETAEKIAGSLQVPLEAFRACVADPATLVRVQKEKAEFKETGARGLPTLWINDEMLSGAQTEEQINASIDRALEAAR